jgi:SAM-dependent methyltransferase
MAMAPNGESRSMDDRWRVWDRDDSVELRTYQRATGQLPEMESTKQLVRLISAVYRPGMSILDVGCAAGHYYLGLRRIDEAIRYHGVDATQKYIAFATNHFAGNPNVSFSQADVFSLPADYVDRFDVVFCCNVLLHLPSIRGPIHNLLRASRKYVFIRTLVADKTHVSKLLYSDDFDDAGDPTNFVHQNTYSRDLIRSYIGEAGDFVVEFIADEFDAAQIQNEHREFSGTQSAVTRVSEGAQIAGSKVFEWEWIKITR